MNQGFVDKIRKDLRDIRAVRYPHIKFVMLWTIFEGWVSEKSGKTRQVDALDWFRLNNNALKDCADDFWQTAREVNGLTSLATRIGFEIPHTELNKKKMKKHQAGSMYAPNPNEKGDLAALMCEIRHNIVHGRWQHDWTLNKPEEKDLVFLSAELLDRWIGWADVNHVFS